MKTFLFTLLLTVTLLLPRPAHAQIFGMESEEKLKAGFRMVTFAEPTTSSFESVAHREYFYHTNQRIAAVSAYSIAPDGRYAIYIDSSTLQVQLFRVSDYKSILLAPRPLGPVKNFEWNEKEGYVLIRYTGDTPPDKFPLKTVAK